MATDDKPPEQLTHDPYAKLHHKQIRFIHEYLIDRNATAAYQRAGYVATRLAAGPNAYRLLKNAQIQAALKAAEGELLERIKLRQYEAHAQLRAVATSDIGDYVVADGNLTLSDAAPPTARKAVQSFHRTRTTRKTKDGDTITTENVRLALWNKLEAIKIAGQAEGWLTPDKEQSEDQQQASNNYFLTLIQLVQKSGITSKEGAESFRSAPAVHEDTIDISPVVKNGHTNGKTNGHTKD